MWQCAQGSAPCARVLGVRGQPCGLRAPSGDGASRGGPEAESRAEASRTPAETQPRSLGGFSEYGQSGWRG